MTMNFLAILLTSILGMIIGSLWYSPILFGKTWMQLHHLTEQDIKKAKKKNMGPTYLSAFIMLLIMNYVLSYFILLANATTFAQGLTTAFWAWLGFMTPLLLGSVLWENKPLQLFWLNSFHYLVALGLSGGILAVWG